MKLIENIIPILRVKDLAASVAYYQENLGFNQDWSMDSFAALSRDGWHVYLSAREEGSTGAWLWVGLEDIDEMYRLCREKGATIKSEMVNNAWAREFQVEDPDGHVLRFGGEPESEGAE